MNKIWGKAIIACALFATFNVNANACKKDKASETINAVINEMMASKGEYDCTILLGSVFSNGFYHSNGFKTVEKTIDNIPNGIYRVTIPGYFNDGLLFNKKKNPSDVLLALSANGETTQIKRNIEDGSKTHICLLHEIKENGVYVPSDFVGAEAYFAKGHYLNTVECEVVDGKLTIKIEKLTNKIFSTMHFGNIVLTYCGPKKDIIFNEEDNSLSFIGNWSNADSVEIHETLENYPEATTVDFRDANVSDEVKVTVPESSNPNTIIYVSEDSPVSADKNIVKGDTCKNLVVTDGVEFNVKEPFVATNATYTRVSANEKMGTLCLPYAIKSTANLQLYRLMASAKNPFAYYAVDSIEAGEPCLFKRTNVTEDIVLEASNVNVEVEALSVKAKDADNVTFIGSYVDGMIGADDGQGAAKEYYYVKNSKIYNAVNYVETVAYRACIHVEPIVSQVRSRSSISAEGFASAMEILENNDDVESVEATFDLNGVQSKNAKGVNIVKFKNGTTKKVVF